MLHLLSPSTSSSYLLDSLWFLFFNNISLLEHLLKGSAPSPLITLCTFPVVGLYLDCLPSPALLSSLPSSFSRPQGNLPLRCLTSWSGWAWSPSQWFGCLSSTVWLLQSRQSTRPNATSANSVPSRASGRHTQIHSDTMYLSYMTWHKMTHWAHTCKTKSKWYKWKCCTYPSQICILKELGKKCMDLLKNLCIVFI